MASSFSCGSQPGAEAEALQPSTLSMFAAPPFPPTEYSPAPGHWAPCSFCQSESRRQTGSQQCWRREDEFNTHLPKPSKRYFQLPPSQRPPCQHWAQGWGHRLHTFLVFEGMESSGDCLGWLRFWACLLQAWGFAGSPKDLQNSTCMGKRAGFHSCGNTQARVCLLQLQELNWLGNKSVAELAL